MYDKIISDIKNLTKKAYDIENKAAREGREMTPAEQGINAEIVATIDSLQRQLPASSPASQVGPVASSLGSRHGGFNSLGEQLIAVAQAGTPGGQPDPRLFRAAASGLNETVPSDGGFLVQQDFSTELLTGAYNEAVVAPLCRRIQVSGNSNSLKLSAFDETSKVSTRFGGIVSYWAAEAAEYTATKPKFRELELNLKKLIGLCYATDELLQDANVLGAVLRQAFASEFAFQIDNSIINGTGSGQPLGILNSGSLVSVAKEAGQRTATIIAENVMKMWARLLPGSEKNAVWLVNKNTLPQLMSMSLSVGTGGVPVYQPMNQLAGAPYQMLLGRPVLFIEQAATLGTVGDIILADLGGGYVLAEKGGLQADMSIHVRFNFGENVFRFQLRIDGQPVRSSALTPFKGSASDTQSHFVALETRS